MAERRIAPPGDHWQIASALKYEGESNPAGVFDTWVDLLVFAAVLGYKRDARETVRGYAKQPDPIRKEVFENHGYDAVLNLLAVETKEDINALSPTEDAEDERAQIFEELANGGLAQLEKELQGAVSYNGELLHIVQQYGQKSEEGTGYEHWIDGIIGPEQ